MYSEVLQDGIFDLIDAGKLRFASATRSRQPVSRQRVQRDIGKYKDR